MGLNNISRAFIKAKPTFSRVNPSIYALFIHRWMRYITMAPDIVKGVNSVIKKEASIPDFIGDVIGISIIASTVNHRCIVGGIQRAIKRAHAVGIERPNWKLTQGLGASRRTWITSLDKSLIDDRIVKQLTIVYHDANKAGKHIDVHLGPLSLVYRVTGKPFEKDLKFNNQGRLTEASKDILLNHVKAEVAKNARVPWNHDHTISNARMDWDLDNNLKEWEGYGAGVTRQVIAQSKVEFYHPEVKSSLHMYAPLLNPNQGLYIYKIYEGNGKSAPILIWGNLIPRDTEFKDRLHLKMIQEADYQKDFLRRVDVRTTTRKYDGASAYILGSGEVEKNHSFKVFSPRMSKETGHRIEYTYKVPEIADRGTSTKVEGMGELLFWKRTAIGQVARYIGCRGAEHLCWNYLSASEIAGILNSNATRPRNVFPEIRLYRIDKWDGQDTFNLPFFENRYLQEDLISRLDNPYMKVVDIVKPQYNTNWEGLVGVPERLSINDGLKVKWWANANDWEVTKVDLKLSKKGNISGVVWFKSLESGKKFKLGPGGLGGVDQQLKFMDNPTKMVGVVFKVHGRNGHEGRAAKIVDEHMDKGIA